MRLQLPVESKQIQTTAFVGARIIPVSLPNRYLKYLQEQFSKNPEYQKVPMVQYAKEDMTDLSYTVGMLFFKLMYDLVQQEGFNRIIADYYREYYEAGGTSDDFAQLAIKQSGSKLTPLFDDWFYGTSYAEYIVQGWSMERMLQHYQGE